MVCKKEIDRDWVLDVVGVVIFEFGGWNFMFDVVVECLGISKGGFVYIFVIKD